MKKTSLYMLNICHELNKLNRGKQSTIPIRLSNIITLFRLKICQYSIDKLRVSSTRFYRRCVKHSYTTNLKNLKKIWIFEKDETNRVDVIT